MSADTNEQPRPKKKRKKPARIDVERAARMLCDLHDLGPEQTAKLHRVTTRTLRRYKALVDEDAALKAKYLELATLRDGAWATERAKALRAAVARATELVAKEEDLDKITRFIEKVGSVDVAGMVLGAGGPRSHQQGSASSSGEDEAGEDAPALN
jgi:hypothetical protein